MPAAPICIARTLSSRSGVMFGSPTMHAVSSRSRSRAYAPSTSTAVCGFAIYVANQLSDRTGLLSIYCDSKPALVKADDNGQDARLFMKIYDRVYLRTDKYAYPYNVDDIKSNVTIGNVYDRLVPVVENYLPDGERDTSWVLIDVAEEPKK